MSVFGDYRPLGRMTIGRVYEEIDQRVRDIERGEPQATELDALKLYLPWIEELVLAELGAHPMGISGLFDDPDDVTIPGRPWTPEDGLWVGTECETEYHHYGEPQADIVQDIETGAVFEVTYLS